MKWLWQVVTALLIAILSGLGVAVFKDPLTESFRGEHLSATISASHWYPADGIKSDQRAPGYGKSTYDQISSFTSFDSLTKDDQFARIDLTNDTSKPLRDIKLDFRQLTNVDAVNPGKFQANVTP